VGGGAQQHAKLIGKNDRNFFFLNTKGCGAGNLKCHTSFCHLALFTDMENIVVKIILSASRRQTNNSNVLQIRHSSHPE